MVEFGCYMQDLVRGYLKYLQFGFSFTDYILVKILCTRFWGHNSQQVRVQQERKPNRLIASLLTTSCLSQMFKTGVVCLKLTSIFNS